jgi:arylformamidase
VWIDVTVPIENGMEVWPGDPETRVERVCSIERGDSANVSAISMCLHAGTHMDAPLHYFAQGAAIDGVPLDAVIGPARVIDVQGCNAIAAAGLAGREIGSGERLLFKTSRGGVLTPDAAEFLAARGVKVVGIDGLSIGPPNENGDQVHRILLAAGVWIIERLDLSAVEPGDYDLICLPLKIPGADGAPARAALRRRWNRE